MNQQVFRFCLLAILAVLASSPCGTSFVFQSFSSSSTNKMSMKMAANGIEVHSNPPNSKLAEMGVGDWPVWGCEASTFPWQYEEKETCYVLHGKVTVIPEGETEGVDIQKGDMAVFPEGMKCTWVVHEAISKHYKFG